MEKDWKQIKAYVERHRVSIADPSMLFRIKDVVRRTCRSEEYLSYCGFLGSTRYDFSASLFWGRIINIGDLVSFEGTDMKALREDFRRTVREYIELCIRIKRPIQIDTECRKGGNRKKGE